ncbi:mitochondrial inner membrane protein OXA1L [Morone saxatilis]|uniref:mitochondrial inner membrane protein OXA1L n=1 Tax=Morone saxatilis TaxID=34816 RepID=UPI0015E21F06|nr:mitochondrial inner membrane protein OXA1L [Morone saxatilis]
MRQIPPNDRILAAPVVEASGLLVSLPADPTPIFAQPITEQIPVERVSVPVVDISPPPSVLVSSSEPASTDPSPVLTHPAIEHVTDAVPTAAEVLQAASREASLTELGLAQYTPVGMVQNFLDSMHLDLGLPWWGAIVVATVFVRLAVFPVIVSTQKEAAKTHNLLPEMTKINSRLDEAVESGDKVKFAKIYSEMNLFQKEHDVKDRSGFLVPMLQGPIFMSFFLALREMAHLPVPSLQTGGMLWFPDLTAADPFYILPLASTGTMFLIMQLGIKSNIDSPYGRALKYTSRLMPFLVFPLTMNFPAAVFTYWLTSNCFSLGQLALLRHPSVKHILGIPERIQHPPSNLPRQNMIESMMKSWRKGQLVMEMEEKERRTKNQLDLTDNGPSSFQTFNHNPLEQTPPVASDKDKEAGGKARPWKDTIG